MPQCLKFLRRGPKDEWNGPVGVGAGTMSRLGGDTAVWWPHFCSIIPRRVNGRWYWREWIWYTKRFGPGGVRRQYGDEFDRLRDDR